MIFWAFAIITVAAVLVAAFASNMRRATLALWIAGFGAGGIYLTVGAETLAVIQWIISTLVAISFVFFAVMFGEFGMANAQFNPPRREGRDDSSIRESLRANLAHGKKGLFFTISSLILGLGFAVVIWFGASQLSEGSIMIPTEGNDLASLGRRLTEEHFLSLEILALTLFLVLVGGGVIARPDKLPKDGAQ